METANAVRGLEPWITNEYEHNGLGLDGDEILGRLIDMVRGRELTLAMTSQFSAPALRAWYVTRTKQNG